MATHDDVGLSQPAASTITKRLDAISLDANSTVVLREVMVLGSPETTNALAAVLAAAPASTEWGLVTRVVGYSTVVSVAAMPAGSTSVTVAAITGPVSTAAPATSDTGVIVRQVGYSTIVSVAALPANSSQVEIRSITGPVSTAAPGTGDTGVIVRQVGYSTIVSVAALPAGSSGVTVNAFASGQISSAAAAGNSSALLVRVVGGPSSAADFTQIVSSVAGIVAVRPSDTNWASSGGFHFDSSGALLISGASASTTVQVSSVGGVVVVAPQGTSNSSIYFPVRITNGTAFAALAVDYVHASTLTDSTVTGPISMLRASSTTPPAVSTSDMFVAPWGTLNGAAMMSIVTSSGASAMDSSTPALKVNVVAGATAGPTSTAAPASNDTGLVVRQVGYSTIVSVAALPAGSSGVTINAFAAAVHSSAAAAGNSSALLVRVVGGASSAADFISNVSSVAGIVAVRPSDTNWASSAGFHFDSSGSLLTSASFTGSTIVTVAALPLISSAAAAANSSALSVRVVGGASSAADFPVAISGNSTAVVSAFASGLISSAASAGNSSALLVRVVGGASSAADFPVSVSGNSTVVVSGFASGLISSAAPAGGSSGLVVWPVGYSTIVTVAALPANSSQVEVRAMPAASTTVSVTTFPSAMVSSLALASGSSALNVRLVPSSHLSTSVVVTSSNSTVLLQVLSSQATAQRVHAFFVGVSTNTSPSTVIFMDGSTNHVWGMITSSLVWGANLAVAPPAELFRASAGNPLNVVLQNASTAVQARISVSWRQDV